MKKMFKRLSSLVLTGILVFCLVPANNATATDLTQQNYFMIEDVGNGVTKETTITVEPSLTRDTNSKRVTSSNDYKYDGVTIATVKLITTFNYDGKRAWVVDSTYSKSLSSGWSYTNHSITDFGASSQLTATLKNGSKSVSVNIFMSCSPTGKITYS